jgi:phosphopantetheinyl transferase (holo-ACP synthase)
LRFRQVSIAKLPSGAPTLSTELDAAEGWKWHLSVSHDAGLMTAVVVLESRPT